MPPFATAIAKGGPNDVVTHVPGDAASPPAISSNRRYPRIPWYSVDSIGYFSFSCIYTHVDSFFAEIYDEFLYEQKWHLEIKTRKVSLFFLFFMN